MAVDFRSMSVEERKQFAARLNAEFMEGTPEKALEYFLNEFPTSSALSSSLSYEDQTLTDMMVKIRKDARIFTLDTGRQFPETYELIDRTNMQYGIRIEVYFPVEYDTADNVIKLNPLILWTEQQVKDYVTKNGVPFNKLHKQGFPSIGCQPCTRAVRPGEDIRAGRWWWEDPDHRECGLHSRK